MLYKTMDFDENDLRPMTGLQRPMTGVSMAGENNNEEDFSGSSKFPNTGSRPVTTKPLASGRRPSTNRPMTSMQGRPITSMASRPTTGFVPDWMWHFYCYSQCGYLQDVTALI